jgi:sugar phosphate isomerase/epimerase
MKKAISKLPFILAAPSMVFGKDLMENVRRLAGLMNHVEILLFHTPSLHNVPDHREVSMLNQTGDQENITYSVHLPASLEIASRDRAKREESVRLAIEICRQTSAFNPCHYILHIPFTAPTLVPVPGLYFKTGNQGTWSEWTKRALDSLEMIISNTGLNGKLLVENINYSPSFLEPFWEEGCCKLCLDLGHLLLGKENVSETLKTYLNVTEEIHLHGVQAYDEHISLAVLPANQVHEWLTCLVKASFAGIINLEVFSPQDLEISMKIVLEAFDP